MNMATQATFELELQARDDRMLGAFKAVGPHWRNSGEMENIDSHQSVAYLIAPGGSDERVHAIMMTARALLDAGGMGVKVESSGIAHSPEYWRHRCDSLKLWGAYKAFVVVVAGSQQTHSCGMHAFGLRDVLISEEEASHATRVAREFSWYVFTERPIIKNNQTFSTEDKAFTYRILESVGVDYGGDTLFPNPYGTWALERL